MSIHASQRRDVDDVAAATFLHLRNRFMATIENAAEIRFEYGAKIFRRSFFDCCPSDADAGVVDENVEAAELFFYISEQRLDLFVIAHVARKYECMTRALSGHVCKLATGIINVARADAHFDAFAKQCFRDAAADSFRTAGDDCGFVLEIHCAAVLPSVAALPPDVRKGSAFPQKA